MAYEENVRSRSLDADSSVGIYSGVPGMPGSLVPNGAKQYCLLRNTGKHQCGLMTAASQAADFVGVLQNKPQGPGHAATVGYEGVTKVIAGESFSAGALLTADAQGRAVVATTGQVAVLRAEAPSAGANEVVPASFIPGGRTAA